VGIERFAYRPLRGAPRINLLITAVGVSLLFENLGQLNWPFELAGEPFFGPTPQNFPTGLAQSTLGTFIGVKVTNLFVTVMLTSLSLMLALEWIIQKTRIGKAMRAVSHDHDTASLMGINVNKVISFTFFIGSCLAAAGAVLFCVMYPKVDPLMGIMPGLKAFVAAVVGGIGNIRGAVVGSLVIASVESLATLLDLSTYRDAFVFAILIGFLVWKPTGLFGKYEPEKV
jgi:branched-chain amino acid transport system permease protein